MRSKSDTTMLHQTCILFTEKIVISSSMTPQSAPFTTSVVGRNLRKEGPSIGWKLAVLDAVPLAFRTMRIFIDCFHFDIANL